MRPGSFLLTFFAALLTTFALTSCSSGGSSGEPSPLAGFWIEELDANAIEQLTMEDGSCAPMETSQTDAMGVYYLEITRIDASGTFWQLATVTPETPATGDFYEKGRINSEGKLILSESFKDQWQKAGLTFKEYVHTFSLKDEKTLSNTVEKQVVVHEGETSTMENRSSQFFKLSNEELRQSIAFAKDCIAKKTLKP